MEDVVYMKDGSIYRGQILEMIPNQTLKVETIGGNVFAVKMADVEKTTKEERLKPRRPEAPKADRGRAESTPKAELPPWEPRLKGYFFQSQILIEGLQGGLRVVNGYKFGRFGYLGLGVGVDNVISSPSVDFFDGGNDLVIGGGGQDGYRGVYLPIYLFHQGDILNKKITPFYAVEAGYAFALQNDMFPFNNSNGLYREGGIMGGAGIGVRFNGRKKRAHFSLLLNVNVKNVRYQQQYYAYDDMYSTYIYDQEITDDWLFFPGLRLGIGF